MERSYTTRTAVFLLALAFCTSMRASHICGGEIYYNHSSGNTYLLELHIYTDSASPVDTIWVDTGDGNTTPLALNSTSLLEPSCCAYRTEYLGEHTYAGPGLYLLRAELYSRSASLINIQDPSFTPMCITTQLVINSLIGPNNSVRFNTPQTYSYYIGGNFVHATQPTDADGDSLSFELIDPAEADCMPIYPYSLPHEVAPTADTCWIDPVSGVFTWDQPVYVGKYVIAIRCWEWRNGIQFSSVVRDMNLCINATTAIEEVPSTSLQVMQGEAAGTVDLVIPDGRGGQLLILDMEGRKVAEVGVADERTTIDLGELAPGTYVAQFRASGRAPEAVRFVLGR